MGDSELKGLTQRKVCDRQTNRQTNIIKRNISAGELYSTMCRMGRWSFWSWFLVGCRKSIHFWKTILHFRSQWPWPWPLTLDLRFALLLTLVQRHVSTELEVCTAFLFRENRRHVCLCLSVRPAPTIFSKRESRRNFSFSGNMDKSNQWSKF